MEFKEKSDMMEIGKKLKTVLEGHANFWRQRALAPAKHQSHLWRWVREFLHVAAEDGGFTGCLMSHLRHSPMSHDW